VSLFEFENRERIFQGIYFRVRFCLVTLGASSATCQFAFLMTRVEHLADQRRCFVLSQEDIALINPNTRTCPTFRSKSDAELTKNIYHATSILMDERDSEGGNPWHVRFGAMFHMSNDSELFRTAGQLAEAGAVRNGSFWIDHNGIMWVPLYEAKMIHQYDHRYGDFANAMLNDEADAREIPHPDVVQLSNPNFKVTPRYWVVGNKVEERLQETSWNRRWLLGWREITNATNERTVIATSIPKSACGHKLPLIFVDEEPNSTAALLANLNALVLDYVAKQKVAGTSLSNFIIKQLPILAPNFFGTADHSFITPRVLELTFTAVDMRFFAKDVGYEGPPFRWDEERRAQLLAELDAYYAYLYGLTRRELEYILDPKAVMGKDYPSETFRVLKER
jgi:hypothetical protein